MNNNTKINYVNGALSIAAAGAIGAKGVTSGIRRALGIRIEEHTTTLKNAKDIIKGGKILDPKFGGSNCSKISSCMKENSEKFVHITGFHKNADMTKVKQELKNIDKEINSDKICKILFDSPLKKPFATIYRKMQRLMYRTVSGESISSAITGKGCKTFYIGGTDNYFNKNFIPDADDFALKTKEPLKVCKTKIGATITALKREGLSGIKQNKSRVVAGVLIATTLFVIAGKLFKNGIEKIKQNKENK